MSSSSSRKSSRWPVLGSALFGWMTLRTEGWRWAYSSHLAADVAIVVAFVLLVGNAG